MTSPMVTRKNIDVASLGPGPDRNYLPSQSITKLHVTGLATSPIIYRDKPSKTGVVIHWRIHGEYLDKYRTCHSLVFDTSKDEVTKLVKVDISMRPYGTSHSTLCLVTFVPTRGMTGQQVIDFLRNNSLHLYRYNTSGSGCRTWCKGILNAMGAAGIIRSDAEAHFDSVVDSFIQSNMYVAGNYWIPEENGAHFQAMSGGIA